MKRPADTAEVYLCREEVDLRKSIDGLARIVERTLGLDPFARRLHVYCNRRRSAL